MQPIDYRETLDELHRLSGRFIQAFANGGSGTPLMHLLGTLLGGEESERGALFEIEDTNAGFYVMKNDFVDGQWDPEGPLRIRYRDGSLSVRVAIPPDVIADATREGDQ